MKNKLHQNAKAKPRKDSLVELFISIKFSEGFVCDRCECHEYYLIKRSDIKNGYILQCKECGKQHTLLGGTIFDYSNLTILQIFIALYLFFTSNRGLSAPDLANIIDVSVKTARRYLRKFRILMVLSADGDNEYPRHMKLHVLPGHKASPVRNFMFKHVAMDKDSKESTDNDKCFMWMKDYVDFENSRVDYSDRNHKMKWLNIIASNFENNIKNIYKSVCKRDMPLLLAEQEFRFNHRYTGRHFIEKMAKYIRKYVPMTNLVIGNALVRYEADSSMRRG
ncbi:transposase [Sharpea azabuensis]|uniref:Transposase n=1 Tax=Sharpea porci TaxID=2652286 RepID=A0A844FY69_9FIRM|nr:transposase [Sharpea porci]MST90219.1 transposase [Sharpea porci]